MQTNHSLKVAGRRGVALVIVLAFVVLLTGLIIAFFSRSILDRQISNSSVSRAKVNTFADGAADAIIGELKQEIVLGSATNTVTTGNVTTTIYTPLAPAYVLPQISGTAGITATGLQYPYNLLKVSSPSQLFYSGSNGTIPPGGNNVVAVSSTTPSLNGRYLTPAYWNQHYLLPITSSTDSAPAQNSFVPPSWILVARDSSNPTQWNSNMVASSSNLSSVVGRYAFAIYHEGGLLDVNAAGYPSTSGTYSAYKNALPYADLTQVCAAAGIPSATATNIIDNLVAWRNYASIPSPNPFPSPGFTLASASNYYSLVVSNTNGYLNVSGTAMNNGQTDRMFASRQQLIKFAQNVWGFGPNSYNTYLNVLNYLTTFSRDLNQPSYIPAVQSNPSAAPVVLSSNYGGNSAYQGDQFINPNFPAVRVQASFTRNDGSTANVGDPFVNKRFALNRLAWITPYGAISNGSAYNPVVLPAVITALKNSGLTDSYLLLGTATNIQKYFGLNWDAPNNRWLYNVHNGAGSGKGIIMLVGRSDPSIAADSTKYVQDASPKREPDFFELLKAGISVGSLGKAAAISNSTVSQGQTPSGYAAAQVPVNERYAFDTSVDYHVIQIGANILSEVNPTSYPIRIAFDDGSGRSFDGKTGWEFQGVTDLPYLQYVFNGGLRIQAPNPAPTGGAADNQPYQYPVSVTGALITPGNAYMIQVPAVWNPYDPNGTYGPNSTTPPPSGFRPTQFRIVIDNNDPLSPSGSSNPSLNVWHGAVADTATTGPSGGNSGMLPPHAVYSYTVSGLGKTTEHPTQPPTYPAPGSGTPITDAVKFDDGNGSLFREPTVIFKAQDPATGHATRVGALTNSTPGNATPDPTKDITSIDANPLPGESDGSKGPWAPLVLGQFPLAFSKDNTNTTTYYTGTGLIGLAAGNGDNRVYFTYRLQYQDASGNWITYDTKYGRTTHGLCVFQSDVSPPNCSPSVICGSDVGSFSTYSWASAIDPRTARFGLITDAINMHHNQAWFAGDPQGWIFNSSGVATVATDGINFPVRPNNTTGFFFANFDSNNLPLGGSVNGTDITDYFGTKDVPFPGYPVTTITSGWPAPVYDSGHGCMVWTFAPGMYAQNNPGAPFYAVSLNNTQNIQPSYYADADGVVRRATGAYVPSVTGSSASSTVGLPTASINGYSGAPQTSGTTTPATRTPFTQSQSRPLLLHRPFRTVAELGYVFRDLPWKNLDFFTPESADAALLDIFCINETSDPNGLVAGKVNLNTRQTPVISAIVSGAYVDDPKVSDATVGTLSGSSGAVSTAIASALVARTTGTNYGPLQNVSELIGKWKISIAVSGSGYGIPQYTPTNPSNNWGVDLPSSSGYKDGQLSYTGFSGTIAIASGTTGTLTLTDAYANMSPASLNTSMSQIQRFREAPIRALGNVGQTRVWNLLIDVVAQTGRYPQTATSLSQFMVEGEQHYWVHVAIDRLTGQVIDKQIEVVKE